MKEMVTIYREETILQLLAREYSIILQGFKILRVLVGHLFIRPKISEIVKKI